MTAADAVRPRLGVLTSGPGRDDALRRELQALAAAGFDVVLVAAAQGHRAERTSLGPVRIERVPVLWRARDLRQESRARRRSWRPRWALSPAAERAAYARLSARSLALPLSPHPGRESVDVAARRQVLRGRHLLAGASARAARLTWRGLDRLTGPLEMRAAAAAGDDDLELAVAGLLDRLHCDVLVADPLMAAVAARASARAGCQGRRLVWLLDRRDAAAARAHLPRRVARAAGAVLDRPVEPAEVAACAARLLGVTLAARETAVSSSLRERPHVASRDATAPALVGIGPANMAGQAWAWAKALERYRSGVRTEVLMVDRGSPLLFPADETVTTATYGRDVAWQERTRDRILSTWSHAVIEAGRPLMGVLNGRTFAADAEVMQQAGVLVALVFHGSELRDPRRHAAEHRWSPFRDVDDDWVQRVQATVDMVRPDVDAFSGPCLVSTPDLLVDLPRAVWLPVVVDTAVWTPHPPRAPRAVPVVVHTPSRAAIKGSGFVDAAVQPLVDAGLVDYRRIEGVPPSQMPQVLAQADVVLDQFAIASYGVLACQAMASQIAVVGHVDEPVRTAVREAAGLDLPIVEADPDSLQQVLRDVVADRDRLEAAAQAGPALVEALHDGRRSADVMAATLGLPPE